jgi:hypothetical protein
VSIPSERPRQFRGYRGLLFPFPPVGIHHLHAATSEKLRSTSGPGVGLILRGHFRFAISWRFWLHWPSGKTTIGPLAQERASMSLGPGVPPLPLRGRFGFSLRTELPLSAFVGGSREGDFHVAACLWQGNTRLFSAQQTAGESARNAGA